MMLSFMDDILPARLIQVVKWVPSSAMMRVFRTSMAGITPAEYFVPQLAVLIGSAVVVLLADAWLVRRLDR